MSKAIGHKFYKELSEITYISACSDCGTVRRKGKSDYSYDSDQYCSNCGKSYQGKTIRKYKPIYVIGHYQRWDGGHGYMLSETEPSKLEENSHNGKGWSYWSYLEDELGSSFFTEPPKKRGE